MNIRSVAIVVPARNEARHIGKTLRSLLPKSAWPFRWSVTVVDGVSTDGTRLAAWRALEEIDGACVIDNPDQLQSAGVNLAVRVNHKRADAVVRADAHAEYPADFVRSVVERMEETGADSVVVGMVSVAARGTVFGRAAAAAQNSSLGNGGARHRKGGASGYVDHGHHAAFRSTVFTKLGGYDESFSHNEDAEFDFRLRAAGGRIWFAADLPITYFVRETPGGLARQYWNHGRGRAKTVVKYRSIALRQLVPVAATAGNFAACVAAPWFPEALLLPAVYLAGVLSLGAMGGGRRGAERLAGVAAAIMHHSWGAGFAWGFVENFRWR